VDGENVCGGGPVRLGGGGAELYAGSTCNCGTGGPAWGFWPPICKAAIIDAKPWSLEGYPEGSPGTPKF